MTNDGGYKIHAFLRVSQYSEDRIKEFLTDICGVRSSALWNDLHLTVYEGRVRLPGLVEELRKVNIAADPAETRFMLLRPGGVNPQSDIEPRDSPIGIRLTGRNGGVSEIRRLRQEIIEYEREKEFRNHKHSTLKFNAFGPREYIPHIKLMQRDNRISKPLKDIGVLFRDEIEPIHFTHFAVHVNEN